MDAFEQIVEGLFQEQNYWTRVGFKVKLTKEEKVLIGKPSMPRPEIDILAYSPKNNDLLWIECKSFLDSRGIERRLFNEDHLGAKRFKIFTDDKYRAVVSRSLIQQVLHDGLVTGTPSLRFCLVAGHIVAKDREALFAHFGTKNWVLHDEYWIVNELKKVSMGAYENNVAVIVAKLLERTRLSDGY